MKRNSQPGKERRLSSEELGLLAKYLAAAKNPAEVAKIKLRLTCGFYVKAISPTAAKTLVAKARS